MRVRVYSDIGNKNDQTFFDALGFSRKVFSSEADKDTFEENTSNMFSYHPLHLS